MNQSMAIISQEIYRDRKYSVYNRERDTHSSQMIKKIEAQFIMEENRPKTMKNLRDGCIEE
jgi:hypothetical protein